jgi:curli biogenesis system outer membrane secretion channel CsgG
MQMSMTSKRYTAFIGIVVLFLYGSYLHSQQAASAPQAAAPAAAPAAPAPQAAPAQPAGAARQATPNQAGRTAAPVRVQAPRAPIQPPVQLPPQVPLEPGPPKHRVAIFGFSHATVADQVVAEFGTSQDVGDYFSDQLAARMASDGLVRVVDRDALRRAMQQPVQIQAPVEETRYVGGLMNLGGIGVDTPQPQENKVGALLGVNQVIRYFDADVLLTGEITAIGRDENRRIDFFDTLRSFFGGHCPARRAVLGVNARIVDLNTGEVMATTTVKAQSLHARCSLLSAPGYSRNATGLRDVIFPHSTQGEAFYLAISSVAKNLERGMPGTHVYSPQQIEGLVADVSDDMVTINVGSVGGVQLGDILVITRPMRTIKDPASGRIIREIDDPVGEISITSVGPFYAIGHFKGTGKVSINDVVKSVIE